MLYTIWHVDVAKLVELARTDIVRWIPLWFRLIAQAILQIDVWPGVFLPAALQLAVVHSQNEKFSRNSLNFV